jgi:transposase
VPSESSVSTADLVERAARLESERDEYKKLYLATLEQCRRLEQGLIGPKRERYAPGDEQLKLAELMKMVVPGAAGAPMAPPPTQVPAHQRAKPTGRQRPTEQLPRVIIEVLPPEVQQQGLAAFDRIGEDSSETLERRVASTVVVRSVRGKYVPKQPTSSTVLQAAPLELPIPRGLAGPNLLADTIVRRFQDHLPLHRQEQMFDREGLGLSKQTIGHWHAQVAELVSSLVDTMWKDARVSSPYLCMDATGVLVQDAEQCRRAHFFVVVSPERHVLFGYTKKHNGKAVDSLLGDYRGPLVVDAHSVYEHLFEEKRATEVACWAHTRRYFFKAMLTDEPRARQGLDLIQRLFQLEREYATAPPDLKLQRRQQLARPIVERFFAWRDEAALTALDATPIAKALSYAGNQREALLRFLEDGRLPIHNNSSENALRREAVGRKNWLFVGSDEGGHVNARLVTLLASCAMHGLEPLGYLRDLLIVLPGWNQTKLLELAPLNWKATSERAEVKATLAGNVYRRIALGELKPTPV